MSYSVDWAPAAEEELAAIWLAAPDRDAVTQAAQEIDQLLQADPMHEGESRSQGRRITFIAPLGVNYHVFTATQRVLVLNVWRSRKAR